MLAQISKTYIAGFIVSMKSMRKVAIVDLDLKMATEIFKLLSLEQLNVCKTIVKLHVLNFSKLKCQDSLYNKTDQNF